MDDLISALQESLSKEHGESVVVTGFVLATTYLNADGEQLMAFEASDGQTETASRGLIEALRVWSDHMLRRCIGVDSG